MPPVPNVTREEIFINYDLAHLAQSDTGHRKDTKDVLC